jgi:methionine-rich copper-binding protein CopC
MLQRDFPEQACNTRRAILRLLIVKSAVVLFLMAMIAAGSKPAWAHAVLVDSKPKSDSTVAGQDLPIWLRFNVRVDGNRSKVHLIAPNGSTIALDPVKQPTPDTLQSHAGGLKPGAYKLEWQVLASDGHISKGEVAFTVK